MFKDSKAFSGYSVDDIPRAKQFYGETLGLNVSEESDMLRLNLAGGGRSSSIPRRTTSRRLHDPQLPGAGHGGSRRPADGAGVKFEHYEGELQTDEKGIMRGDGPDIAWFTDPAGNVLSVLDQ